MNKSFVAIFLLANIAFSSAVFLKKGSKMNFDMVNKLREIDAHPFGNKILDTIALQLQSNAPMADIAKLLHELVSSTASQLQTGQNKANQKEQECKEYLERERAAFNKAEQENNEATAAIEILHHEIGQLTNQVKNLESQINILNSREVELKAARERDRADFERRQQQGPGVIEALELIVDKLSAIEPTEDGRTVLAQLSKIGASNPIASLLQIASTFSEESLNKVISQLDNLRVSIQESLKDDAANEAEAEAEFRHLLGEIQSTRTQVTSALAEAKATLKAKQANLEVQEAKQAAAKEAMNVASTNIANKEAECQAAREAWAENKKSLEEELELLKTVERYIVEKLAQMKDYIKTRAEGF